MKAHCLGDGGECHVTYASFLNEMRHGAVYQEELPTGIYMLLIPAKTKNVEKYQRYRHFTVEGDEGLYESIFVNTR